MYKSLFIASPKPLDKDGWNDLLAWTDSEIAEAIYYADFVGLITDKKICVNDLRSFKYLTVETKDENNLLVTISEENRQKCLDWKADIYRKYADDIQTGNRFSQNWVNFITIEHMVVDFFLPNYGSRNLYSKYSENLPDKFYVCRNMYYLYNM